MVRITNLELIEALRVNGRETFTELAKRFGVTETAIRKRVRKLERDGIIIGYSVDVDTRKIGFNTRVIIGVDTIPEKYMDVMGKLRSTTEVKSMHSCSGDHMLLIECWFKDSSELSKFAKRIEKMEGVTKTCPAIIMEKIK